MPNNPAPQPYDLNPEIYDDDIPSLKAGRNWHVTNRNSARDCATIYQSCNIFFTCVLAFCSGLLGVDGFGEFVPGWARFTIGISGLFFTGVITFCKSKEEQKNRWKDECDNAVQKFTGAIRKAQGH